MKMIKTEGIVVGEQNYSESSKILKIFTKDLGLISVISKGCKKPKSSLREGSNKLIYANFDISYRDNGLSTLVGIDIIDIFKNIVMDYHDIEKKMYAFTIIDLTIQVLAQKQIEPEEIKDIYEILISSIKKIDEGIIPKILLDIVMLKYLKYLGVLPNLDSCSICGSTYDIVSLDSKSFGFVCRECYTNEKLTSDSSLKLIRMLYYVDISKIKKVDSLDGIEDVEEFIDNYYQDHTGIYFNIKKKLVTLNKMNAVL